MRPLVWMLLVSISLASCGGEDESVASNEGFDLDGGEEGDRFDGRAGSGASWPDGGTGGGSGDGGAGGIGASGGSGGAAGSGGSSECDPNDQENVGNCERCGRLVRTCGLNGQWGLPECLDQGVCETNDTEDCMCSTYDTRTACCGQRVCSSSCTWGGCQLKPGASCDWEAGGNFRCCGTYKWEYCLDSCVWSGNCADCLQSSCPNCG